MSCRAEVLAAFESLNRAHGRVDFSPAEVLAEVRRAGSSYKDSSVRTHVIDIMRNDGTLVRSGLYTTNGLGYMLARLEVGGSTRDFNIDLSVPALREIVLARPGDAVRMDVLSVPEGTDEVRSVKVTPKADAQGEATR